MAILRSIAEGDVINCSSIVDDMLLIVRKVMRRAHSTGSPDAAAVTVNNVVAMLETTFYGALSAGLEVSTVA